MKVLSPIILSVTIVSFKCVASEPYVFKRFDEADGLPSTQVYQSIQDKDGYMWFATDRGVSRYDGHNFTTFSRKDGLTDEVVFGFFLEKNVNRLWLYTYYGGLCYYENNQFVEPHFNCKLKELLTELNTPVIVSLYVDENQDIWIGTELKNIIKVSSEGKIELVIGSKYIDSPDTCAVICLNPLGVVYNGAKSLLIPPLLIYSYPGSDHTVIKAPLIRQVHDYTRVKIYRTDIQSFILAYGPEVFKIHNHEIIQRYNLGADNNSLYALTVDTYNNLWVGTNQGVFCFSNQNLSVQPKVYLKDYKISSIHQDHEGGYWFTSLENGLFYLPHYEVSSYPTIKATAINSNSFGVYVGLANKNAMVFPNGKYERVITFNQIYSDYSRIVKINDDDILIQYGYLRNLFKDSVKIPFPNKQIALRNNDNRSLYFWNYPDHIFCATSLKDAQPSVCFELNKEIAFIKCATATKNLEKIFLATSRGFFLYENSILKNLSKRFPLFSVRITDLDLINEQTLLVTTRGNGVMKYNFRQNKLVKLNGIKNQSCNQSYIDPKGTVWVASYSGVTRIDDIESDNPQYYYYNKKCGLISDEVYDLVEYNGHIWAATSKGVSHWSRDWIPEYLDNKAQIHQITVNGDQHDFMANKSLNYIQNHLQFFFTTISFQEPIEYHYRLKGLHSNWITTNDRSAVYSSLKPGHYTFELKHTDEETIQSSVDFTIKPPLWLNPWFWLAIGLLLAIVMAYILRVRYRIIRKENKLYELFIRSEQKALRAQINPHFLFNSFNSILELVYRKEYNSVQTYMKRLAQLMRLVLQNSREEEISLAQELELLERYLELEKLRFGNFLHFSIEVKKPLDPLKTLLPSLLLQPYVENALKHGIRSRTDGNGLLQIIFDIINDQLRVQIIDNGKGYSNTIQNSMSKRRSHGMKINGERIQLFSEKEDFNIKILALNPLDNIYLGTIVEIYLPLKTTPLHEASAI